MTLFLIGVSVWVGIFLLTQEEPSMLWVILIAVFISGLNSDDEVTTANIKAKQHTPAIIEKVEQSVMPHVVATKKDTTTEYKYGLNNPTPVIGWEVRNENRW